MIRLCVETHLVSQSNADCFAKSIGRGKSEEPREIAAPARFLPLAWRVRSKQSKAAIR